MFSLNTIKSVQAFKSGSPIRIRKGVLPALALAFTLSFGTAWSYENSASDRLSSVDRFEQVLPSAAMDVCDSLLHKTSHAPSASVSVRNQRTAGKVAALGMLLGARFALEPDSTDSQDEVSARINDVDSPSAHKSARSAQAIASYRQCLKAQALNQRFAIAH